MTTRVAEWVNGARRSAGLTQRQLAERSGVPQPTIARIESGKQMPRADTLAGRGIRTFRGAAPGRRQEGAASVVTEPFDPLRALRVLDEYEVRYVVIGGFAADLLGAPVNTNDLDICYERTAENMNRLAAALKALGAKLRVAGVDEELPFILDGKTLAAGDSFTFDTSAGALDVLGTPSGTAGFRDLAAKAHVIPTGDLQVLVVALPDLMRMKRASARVKDKMHLEVLAALQEMLEQTSRE
jgi:DNA-binding XRE family transcriptional regulator